MVVTTEGFVYAWGGSSEEGYNYGVTPRLVPGLSDVDTVAIGLHHAIALRADHTVMEWARGNTPKIVEGLSDIIAIAAGMSHSVALDKWGNIYTWGNDDFGQLGRSGSSTNPTKVNLPGVASSIATGWYNTFAIMQSDGSVYSWGHNDNGELGHASSLCHDGCSIEKVVNLQNVVSVSSGLDHTVALLANGDVYSWGRNNHGQLGVGQYPASSMVPMQVLGPDGIGFFKGLVPQKQTLR